MTNPTFDIQLTTNSLLSRVTCNGEDISNAIHAIQITQIAGQTPIIKIQLTINAAGNSLRVQCEALGLIVNTLDEPIEIQNPNSAPQISGQSMSS